MPYICMGLGRTFFQHMTKLEEYLDIIPETIERPILKTEWVDGNPKTRWSEYNCTYKLRMGKHDKKFEAYYVYTGFEGETQILPISDGELRQYLEFGGILEYDDISKPTLEEALENLICWLKSIDLI